MIIVKIKCGLGNQMFQYALGRRLSLDWQDELKFDLSWFSNLKKGDIPRDLEIDEFKIKLNQATEKEIFQAMPSFLSRTIDRIKGRLNRNHFYRFYPGLLKKKKDIFLDGYFQSYKYFNPIRDILIKDFTLKDGYSLEAEKIKEEIEASEQSVAIHIRRGDFITVSKNYNGLCSLDYYKKGIDIIKEKYSNIKLFVFSDDIEWAKNNLKFDDPMVFCSKPSLSSAEEILLMSLCKHQIIANSTFSWWAAWLNQNSFKIVIAPSVWLIAANIKTNDLIPSEWVKI